MNTSDRWSPERHLAERVLFRHHVPSDENRTFREGDRPKESINAIIADLLQTMREVQR